MNRPPPAIAKKAKISDPPPPPDVLAVAVEDYVDDLVYVLVV